MEGYDYLILILAILDAFFVYLIIFLWRERRAARRREKTAARPGQVVGKAAELDELEAEAAEIAEGAASISPAQMIKYLMKPDLIARQGGQKRNRVHIYRQPYGYPIRYCDWSAQDLDDIEILGRWEEAKSGPATPIQNALIHYAHLAGRSYCKNCHKIAFGKMPPILSIIAEARAKGAL